MTSCENMRIVSVVVLGVVTSCIANRSTAPGTRLSVPDAQSVARTPDSPRLMAPDTRGLMVLAPAPSTSFCVDCHHWQVIGPYVMIIDGAVYRMPEDSARANKRLRPIDIEDIRVIAGVAAAQRYHTDGRPAILIKTKRSKKH